MSLRTTTHDDQRLPVLAIRIIDVSPLHVPMPPVTRASRAARVLSATRANIVRLVPGATTFPLVTASGAPGQA